MKKYDNYKDSGIEWLGEIPKHWKVTKLKFIGDAIGGLTYAPNNVVDNENEGVLVLRSSNIQNGKLTLKDNVFVNLEISDKLTLKKGDILICSRNGSQHLIGKNICIDERTEGSTFGAFMMIFRSQYYGFLNQYFNSPIFTSQSGLFLTATINQLTSGTLNNFYIAIPDSIDEQTTIANYLDHKTTQIDTLITKKEQFILLLQEERTAVINQAVTKGLDPKVMMKDSGIEWLGEIPEHWEVKRMKYLCDVTTGGKDTENREDDGKYPFFVRSQTIERISSYSFDGEAILTAGDGVGVCKVWHYVNEKFDFHQRVYMMSNFQPVLGKYLFYYLKENFGKEVMKLSAKSTVDSLRRPMFQNFMVCFGSLDEQKKIIEEIEFQEIRIDTLISKSQQEIELLKEYKTALISEVVTGKVDVRNVVLN
jgi:type I restriction enzyme S subunit